MPAAIEDARPPASTCGISHETSLLSAGTSNSVEDTKNRGVWRQALCNLVIGVVYTHLTAVRSLDSVATQGYTALLPSLLVQHDCHIEPRVATPPRGPVCIVARWL